jgi:predicted dehydrogenase
MIAVADVAVERAKQVADELEIKHSCASLEEMV